MRNPRQIHCVTAKHVLRYLRVTVGYGLRYASGCNLALQVFSDLDWVRCVANRKSTSRCCFSLGSVVISWYSRKQTSIALSTAEAEYMAANTVAREAVWLQKLLARLFGQIPGPTVIHCDNQSCIQMSVNPVFHDKTKHIEIQYHYIHDMVQKGVIELQYVSIDDQTADILTNVTNIVSVNISTKMSANIGNISAK